MEGQIQRSSPFRIDSDGVIVPKVAGYGISGIADPVDEHGVGDRGYNDLRYTPKNLDAATITDPAVNAAVSTVIIDGYGGVIITLTGAGNTQTLQDPTDTASIKRFIVVSDDANGANTIEVNGITMSAGEAQKFIWDGSAWIAVTAIDADDITLTPTGDIVATDVQAGIAELDTEKMKRITSVDNEIARFDSTGGDVQGYSSNAPNISDTGNAAFPGGIDSTPIGAATPATGTFTTLTANAGIRLLNDIWMMGKNFAGSAWINMFKLNTDDEIEVGATMKVGTSETVLNPGEITRMDAPVSDASDVDTPHSYTDKIDGNNITTTGAVSDGAGGVTGLFFKTHGARMVHKTDGGAADYNPSILTSDHIVTVDTTAAARAVTISTEDRDSGSPTKPRIFIIKDIAGNAAANNITISIETAGTIDGGANVTITADYGSKTIVIDGTNGYTI